MGWEQLVGAGVRDRRHRVCFDVVRRRSVCGVLFGSAGGGVAKHLAKWNGNSWTALGTGMDNWVYALAVSGNDLYAGGVFRTTGDTAAHRAAKWNGSSWTKLGL